MTLQSTVPEARALHHEVRGLTVGVAIATTGRPDILAGTLANLRAQRRSPDRLFVCYATPDDLRGVPCPAGSVLMEGRRGLTLQRNQLIAAAFDLHLLLFLDDDFLVAPDYIERMAACFADNPEIVGASGSLIADGTRGPGISLAEGQAMLADDRVESDTPQWCAAPHLYGCNMMVRLSTVRERGLAFDERLPLYAWSEDMDFSYRLKRHGVLAEVQHARGVHLGTKSGRASGKRLGYSQVANPLYLLQKGSYPPHRVGYSIGRNLARNVTRAVRPEPHVDRRGRLHGNLVALGDLCRGQLRPERILDL